VPVFGICPGHQMLGHALGPRTEKLAFGHRGANHPVRRSEDGRVEIAVQNHGYAVDTCAAEFAALTPYYYSAFESEDELARDERPSIVVLGSGPNRIGQGIEFDYCCVHAAETARALGYAAVMINWNPATVSTDHGVSDRLYWSR